MTINIDQVNTASDTFQNWIDRTNEVINAISNKVLTANQSSTYAETSGNSFLYGGFGANTLIVTDYIRGGDLSSGNTLVIASNTYFGGDVFSFGDNIQILPGNATSFAAIVAYGQAFSLTTSTLYANSNGPSTILVDSWSNNNLATVEYSIYIKDKSTTPGTNASSYTKLIVLHDEGEIFINEYGTVVTNTAAGSNGVLGTFNTTVGFSTILPFGNVATINLYFTPHTSVSNCKMIMNRNGVPQLFPDI